MKQRQKKDLMSTLEVFTAREDEDSSIIEGFEKALQEASPRTRGRILMSLADSVSPCFYKKAIECYAETLATVGEIIEVHGDTEETNPELKHAFREAHDGLGSLGGRFPEDCARVYKGLMELYPKTYSQLFAGRLRNLEVYSQRTA